ncbi:MAG TPA: protein kinase [Kofleriaceae bacterium]|nr:protein kinase [Kofleriaceae bacterium]
MFALAFTWDRMQVCTSCKKLLKAGTPHCPDDGAVAETVETLPKGTRLGAYKIDRMLGEGGMGFVYEATHEVLNRRSAIKMLRPELASHAHIVTRFLNEAKAVNLIDHQHIVNVYDYGDSHDGSVYFVMEFLEGETLDDLMHKRRPMAMPLLLHVFGQVARALAAAHGKQIVHRDLKPANVFVVAREDNPYFIKLLDFGIAQLRGAGAVQGLTIAGSVMGTPQYMSPEQVSGGVVDARSDVWAMGVMLYRAATGQAPFQGEEFAELADKILHQVPRPAGELVAMPAALSSLITSCLERSAEARCPSIAALIEGFERVKRELKLDDDAILAAVMADAGALGERAPLTNHPATRESLAGSMPRYQGGRTPGHAGAAPAPRRSRLGLYAAAAGAIVLLGGGAYAMVRRGDARAHAPEAAPGASGATPPVVTNPVTVETSAKPADETALQAFHAGGWAAARGRAEQQLRTAITAGTLQQKGFAIDAIGLAHARRGAPLLYEALKTDDNEVRVKAARALCTLGLPEAAPKVRAALEGAGELPKTDLAAAVLCLGDQDARKLLVRSLDKLAGRLVAATALATAGDPAGRAVFADILETIPAGRDEWRAAAAGLTKLGDAKARKLLEAELPQADAGRALGAAEILARAGDSNARDLLIRDVADQDFARRGDAAIALGRLGDDHALAWLDAGLASRDDPEERKLALGLCGMFPAGAKPHLEAIATLASNDPDLSVRMTAAAALLAQ